MNGTYVEEKLATPVWGEYDVIVAGGGVAGVAAALSARRRGKSVLLIKKSLTLGGLATLGLINFFVPMCNGRGVRIISGLCDELLRDSIRYGYDTIPAEWRAGEPGPGAQARYVTAYSAPIFSLVLTDKLDGEGIDILLDTVIARPLMKGSLCEGLVVENKTGRGLYRGRMIVDATGDLDIFYRAGAPTVQGKNYFTYWAKGIDLDHIRAAEKSGVAADAIYQVAGGEADLYGGGQRADQRLYGGTTAEDVTEYVIKNQKILLDKLKIQNRLSRDVVQLPGMPQFRTTRHLAGDYSLREADVYRHFDDSIGAVNDFDHRDSLYEIPFRCLVRTGYDNLITAGRSISAEGWAWDVTRVIPPAIITGQAAGLACALALNARCAVGNAPIGEMQAALGESGVMVHFDDRLVPEDGRAGVSEGQYE